MNETIRKYCGRILAGCCVSLGAFIYLKVGGPLGAVMFGVGLMSVLTFRFELFTGQIKNFSHWRTDFQWLLGMLLFNAVGCLLASCLVRYDARLVVSCQQIVECRADLGFLKSIVTGIGCGFIMTLIVTTWKKTPVPLLLGIPAFILSGMTHSVADVFFYSLGYEALTPAAFTSYAGTVLGNFLGGVAYKLGSTVSE